jgi:hypothetical protein
MGVQLRRPRVWVKVIHEKSQFLESVAPARFKLAYQSDPID